MSIAVVYFVLTVYCFFIYFVKSYIQCLKGNEAEKERKGGKSERNKNRDEKGVGKGMQTAK